MSIEALILAKLHNKPEARAAKNGKPFVTCKVRAAVADAESVFINAVAFSESACAALLALDAGDSLALAGTLRVSAWTGSDGTARPNIDLVVGQVLTPYALAKKRKAAAQADEPRQPASAQPRQAAGEDFGAAGDWAEGSHE